jgi:hypothetical protein
MLPMINWIFVLVPILVGGALGESGLFINEFMASNASGLTDPQDQTDDWIELYNGSDQALDMGGLYLTDDLSRPTKWRIPVDNVALTTIAPGQFLLIWADSDATDEGLHAGFSLSASGEEIGLYDRDGITQLDTVVYSEQTSDISYGRYPDGADLWQLMGQSTPGQSNVEMQWRRTAEVIISQMHGFYEDPFQVTLSTDTDGATIWYSLDGSTPYYIHTATATERRRGQVEGESQIVFTGIQYTDPISINRTTCLRAIAVKDDWAISRVATATYLFTGDVIRQSSTGQRPGSDWPSGSVNGQSINYGMDPDVVNDPRYSEQMDDALRALPSFSLVTDVSHLFDPSDGIFVHAQSDGIDWERPVSIELLHPDGTSGFQIDGGLRIRGGFSRSGNNPKHAFRLFFRTEYGDGLLRYPLFGEEGVDEFDKVDLRTSQNYSWSFQDDNRNTMVREVFSRDLQGKTGHPYTRSRYYHLYLNGQYWGIFQTQERAEASFGESYLGGDRSDYDVMKSDRSVNRGMLAIDGNSDAYRRLYDEARAGLGNRERYCRLQGLNPDGTPNPAYEKLLDVENLIDFMVIEYYTADRDGPGSRFGNRPNNIFCIYNRANPDGWKWFHHDNEHTLGVRRNTADDNLVVPFTSAGAQWQYFNPHWLHEQLAQSNPEYRRQFGDHVHRHFFNNGLLTPGAAIGHIQNRAQQIDLAIIAESARWGDSKRSVAYTRDDTWLTEISWLMNQFLPMRTDVVLDQLKSVYWYPDVEAPVFFVNGHYQHGGMLTVEDELSMGNPNQVGRIYYSLDGSDPRLVDVEASTTHLLVPLHATKEMLVPRSAPPETWKDVDFDSSAWQTCEGSVGYDLGWDYVVDCDLLGLMWGMNAGCLIRIPFEVERPDALAQLDLYMRYDDGFVAYLNGVEVASIGAPDPMYWNSPAVYAHEALEQPESFNISAHLDLLRSGANVLAVHGLNSSATSTDFILDVRLEAQNGSVEAGLYGTPLNLEKSRVVKSSVLLDGKWSALNEAVYGVGTVAESLRIAEIMYHGLDPNDEFIDLVNIGTEFINLNHVQFTRGIRFVFGDIVLGPNEHVLVVKDAYALDTLSGCGLTIAGQYSGSLSNGGERLVLEDATGITIHDFRYDDDWYASTDGEGLSLVVDDVLPAIPQDYSDKAKWRPSLNLGGIVGKCIE